MWSPVAAPQLPQGQTFCDAFLFIMLIKSDYQENPRQLEPVWLFSSDLSLRSCLMPRRIQKVVFSFSLEHLDVPECCFTENEPH